MTKNYFPEDSYETPDKRRSPWDLFFLGSRWYFWFSVIELVMRSSRIAKRGEFSEDVFVDMAYAVFRSCEKTGTRCHISGLSNIDKCPGPAVFVGNHMSAFETMVLKCFVSPRKKLSFVVKKSLLDYPVFGNIMRNQKCITLERKKPMDDFKTIIQKGVEQLKQGYSIMVFPQATRGVRFNPEKFNSIGVKLARRASVPVIPVALKTDFLGVGSVIREIGPINRRKDVFFHFGEHMQVEGNGKITHRKIIDFILEHLEKWKKDTGRSRS